MTIKTSCPHCSQSYTLADTQRGKTVRCKSCTVTFTVRDSQAPRSRDVEDDLPLPRPKRKGGVPTGLLIGGIVALVLLLICLGVGGGSLLWYFARGRVTEDNYAKLKMGMSEAEVKAILGEPTDSGGFDRSIAGPGNRPGVNLGLRVLVWREGANQITVTFINNKVTGLGSEFRKPRGR